jgi:hypothetical protein
LIAFFLRGSRARAATSFSKARLSATDFVGLLSQKRVI